MPLVLALEIHEKERLVLLNRSAQCCAKLVEVELLTSRGEVATRVQLRVAEEFEYRSVQLVSSRLALDQNGRTRAGSELGRVVVRENLEFLNRIDRRQNADTAGGEFVVVHAVEEPVRALRARSAD